MKTDLPLKKLFELRPEDLLEITGDQGATVRSVGDRELKELRRQVDCVVELERRGEVYLRHLEFQDRDDPNMPRRCFEYNTLLHLESRLPVVTTVLYVTPPGPSSKPVYRSQLGEQVLIHYRFECVKLWELDAGEAVASGKPGIQALAPLMSGVDLRLLGTACRTIERSAPEPQKPDLLAILHVLAEQRYTGEDLKRLIGRERIMQSIIWQEARAEGLEEGLEKGLKKGELRAERRVCRAMVKRYHPALLDDVAPTIDTCTDLPRLRAWTLEAPALSDEDCRKLLSDGESA